jgi:hypothetical protein
MRASRRAASFARGTTPTLVGAGFTSLVMFDGVLRPAVVPAVEQYKIDHRNEKHAITEAVEGTTKEMKAVPEKDIGMSSEENRQTAELVALLETAFARKEYFENQVLTGACPSSCFIVSK